MKIRGEICFFVKYVNTNLRIKEAIDLEIMFKKINEFFCNLEKHVCVIEQMRDCMKLCKSKFIRIRPPSVL